MPHVALFEKLTQQRREQAAFLNHPDFAGVKRMVSHRHQNDTHFLYELLQNANDAQALEACFALYPDGLAFYHDAIRNQGAPFTITDPDLATTNRAARPGHVNAITSIGHGSKSENPDQQPQQGNTIGKFGTGFKSVFIFTNTPHIYDQQFAFSISDLIVPNLLRNEQAKPHFPWDATLHPTMFWIPFNKGDQNWTTKAYHDIAAALAGLRYPLLFLPNLRGIAWQVYDQPSHVPDQKPTSRGTYLREDEPLTQVPVELPGATVQLTSLLQEVTGSLATESGIKSTTFRFLLVSQAPKGRPDLKTELAFAIRPNGTLDADQLFEVFCYFSTKEAHDLRFIVQAPWSLGDSRELLRGSDPWNKVLIDQVADLLAAALPVFRDLPPFPAQQNSLEDTPRPSSLLTDSLLRLLPLDRAPLESASKRSGVSFLPLFIAVTKALRTQRLLPTSTGGHVTAANAYLSESEELLLTFAQPQLAQLTDNPAAAWVFASLNKSRSELVDYVLTLLPGGQARQQFTAPKLVRLFNHGFAAAQSTEWFAAFYRFLDTGPGRSLLITGERPLRNKPFLRLEPTSSDSAPSHASAWHDDNTFQVFLPAVTPVPGVKVLHPTLANDASLASFISLIGLGAPDLLAVIEGQILPRYKSDNLASVSDQEHLAHCRTIVECFIQTAPDKSRRERLCKALAKVPCLLAEHYTGLARWHRPGRCYLPSDTLTVFLGTTAKVPFLDRSLYAPLEAEYGDQVYQLWLSIGISDSPRIKQVVTTGSDVPWATQEYRYEETGHRSVSDEEVIDYQLEKLPDLICTPQSLAWSVNLFDFLVESVNRKADILSSTHSYFWNRYTRHVKPVTSTLVDNLIDYPWLFAADGQCYTVEQLRTQNLHLHPSYNDSSTAASELLAAIGLRTGQTFTDPRQQQAFDLLTQHLARGGSIDDVLQALRPAVQPPTPTPGTSPGLHLNPSITGIDDVPPPPTPVAPTPDSYLEQRRKSFDAAREIRARQETARLEALQKNQQPTSESAGEEQPDDDPTAAAAIRDAKVHAREQQLAEERTEAILRRTELEQALDTLPRYCYEWCQKALELESLLSGEQHQATTELKITFGKGQLDPVDRQHRTLILREPATYIPRNIEDRPNLELELTLLNGTTKSILIDVASVKDFTLRVKLAKTTALTDAGIDLDQVRRFTIRVQSPAFLAEELRRHFNELGTRHDFAPDKDLKADLPAPPQIRFIFGPPGTGKTQHLADKEIRRLMYARDSDARILVLTPTNKAADVLTRRLLEPSRQNPRVKVAPDWLVRYGTTADPDLDLIPNLVQGPQVADLDALDRCTVITTVARFPYATYGTLPPQKLAAAHWDYIILDEASMIPLVATLNVIYQCASRCREFIIGGDPLQIPPVVLAPQLAEENIYSLVQLNDFQTRRTEPHQYEVVPLETQYRATPPLGALFSHYTYKGLLQHARPLTGTIPVSNQPGMLFQGRQDATFGKLTLADVTIIRFPVQPGESILQARRLQQGSQYHPYSGILAAEIVRHVAHHLNPLPTPERPFRIGVISPYTAQAALVREILKQMQLPAEVIDPNENVGTIHGFQGDECDLVFALFSPPEYIATVARRRGIPMLERQYILNVAISRAKDRLVVLVPDEKTRNHDALTELNMLLSLAETHVPAQGGQLLNYHADDVERALFGRADYLTDHSFSAGHQIVNVYGPTERRYEIRLSDTAIDVQFNLTAAKLYTDQRTNSGS
ncbi:DEAD/DEAH box helicase [Hymenobacter aerophilus]|uniref:DEAD/DEAH box helicase n=1 Tax=Hymenobacter aerophilus TaxID=119644 RepID=UPI00036FE7FE|nr:DEAD/DEAH box helicase [Hymenobacter aerophilus]